MYSHVGIIIGAVVSALLGLYVFVPDAGLRTFDFWLSIWQPVVWDVPAILRLPSIDRVGANGLPLWLGGVQNKQEEMIEISTEDLMERLHRLENLLERLQGQSDPLGPEFRPEIAPPFEPEPLAHLVHFRYFGYKCITDCSPSPHQMKQRHEQKSYLNLYLSFHQE